MSGRASAVSLRSRPGCAGLAGGGAGANDGSPAVPGLPRYGRGTGRAGEWPLRTSLELAALPSAVGCARLHAKHVLREWGLEELSDPVELLVSELLTNAVKAARSMDPVSPVRFWLMSDYTCALILVWDASPEPPVRIDVTGDAEGGRGLLLVEAICQQWNWYLSAEPSGKVVWCLVMLPHGGNAT